MDSKGNDFVLEVRKPPLQKKGRVRYGISSRRYRRTVYTYEDWVSHRSNDHLFENAKGMVLSGVVRQLKNEVIIVMFIATFVVVWNGLVAGNTE
jgi:hypothetical protein